MIHIMKLTSTLFMSHCLFYNTIKPYDSFRTTFHQHLTWPFIFKKIQSAQNKQMHGSKLLEITNRKNRESHEVGLDIRFLKGIIFRGFKNLGNFASLTKIYGTLYPKNNIYFFVCKVEYAQISIL